MREIKFRAFSKRLNKMLTSRIIKQSSDSLVKIINEIMPGLNCDKGIFIPTEDVDLKIMQYTGLKDKNGKEIYEGDILLYLKKSKRIVSYKNGAFIRYYGNYNIYLLYDSLIENGCLVDYEVIGNIYENPELLEGNQYESTTDNK